MELIRITNIKIQEKFIECFLFGFVNGLVDFDYISLYS